MYPWYCINNYDTGIKFPYFQINERGKRESSVHFWWVLQAEILYILLLQRKKYRMSNSLEGKIGIEAKL
jgi:hypothetical protein